MSRISELNRGTSGYANNVATRGSNKSGNTNRGSSGYADIEACLSGSGHTVITNGGSLTHT